MAGERWRRILMRVGVYRWKLKKLWEVKEVRDEKLKKLWEVKEVRDEKLKKLWEVKEVKGH
jgi:DNA-binding Xre family transcriptional regulator